MQILALVGKVTEKYWVGWSIWRPQGDLLGAEEPLVLGVRQERQSGKATSPETFF